MTDITVHPGLLRLRSARFIRDSGFGLGKVRIYGRNLNFLDIIGLNPWPGRWGDHLCLMLWYLEAAVSFIKPIMLF